jgi:hypothetical protein
MAERLHRNETALTDSGATPWSLAQERLENPEPGANVLLGDGATPHARASR